MNIPTLAILNAEDKNETWLAHVKRVRRGWFAGSAALFSGILMIEILSQFTASGLYLFALAAIFIVAFVVIDRCDARIGEYESRKIWENAESLDTEFNRKSFHEKSPRDQTA